MADRGLCLCSQTQVFVMSDTSVCHERHKCLTAKGLVSDTARICVSPPARSGKGKNREPVHGNFRSDPNAS